MNKTKHIPWLLAAFTCAAGLLIVLPPVKTFAQANSQSIVLTAIADASVKSDNPTSNYGKTATMATDGSPVKINYLKFDLSSLEGKNILSAKLHIKVATDPSPQSQTIKSVQDISWDEYQITYENRPGVGSQALASIFSNSVTDTWLDVDITDVVRSSAGQVISLAIDMEGTNGITFYTRETANQPQIVVEYSDPQAPTPTSSLTNTPTPFFTATSTPFFTVTPTSIRTATPTTTPVPSSTPGSGNQTAFLPSIADASVKSDNPTSNYGKTATMATDGSPVKINYLKFDLSSLEGKNILSAKLHIKVATDPSSQSQTVKRVQDVSWDEYQITYENRPALGTQALATIFSNSVTDTWLDVDITEVVRSSAGQVISLAIDMEGTNGITFYTRETANQPQIVVEYSGSQSPTPTSFQTNTQIPTLTASSTPIFTATPTSVRTATPTMTAVPSSTPGSGNQTAFLPSIADTFVRSDNPTRNYGSRSTMAVDGRPVEINYLKFDLSSLSGKNVLSAKLHLKVATDSSTQSQNIKSVQDVSWDEYQVTYENRPGISSEILASIYSGGVSDTWLDVDITEEVRSAAGQVISLAIDMDGRNSIAFYTRETVDQPQIVVEYSGSQAPTPTSYPTNTPPPFFTATPTPFFTATPTTVFTATPFVTPTPTVIPGNDPVIAAAGDIACNTSTTPTSSTCYQSVTADLIEQIDPVAVFALGDTQYNSGEYENYLTYYGPTWGRFKSITHPIIGNHEYQTSGASGYFDYFNGTGNFSGPAGDRDKGYYSFNLGTWHIVVLNSECTKVNCSTGSAQEQWLRSDLSAHQTNCTMAVWHEQYFTSGTRGPNSAAKPLVQALYDYNADLILGGHNHYYERFLPQDPDYNHDPNRGITSITIGTGGYSLSGVGTTSYKNNVIRDGKTFGVVTFTLHPDHWEFQFVPQPGKTFSDSGVGYCH